MRKTIFVLLAVILAGTLAAQNDRVTFGLKGNVSKIIRNDETMSLGGFWENFDLEFSPNGMLSKINGKEVKKETEGGRVYYTVEFEDDEYSSVLVFFRTPQGRISTYYWATGSSGL